jgi:hypothetical protein
MSLDWLTAFRLFKRKTRDEWHLEGPDPESHGVTLFEPVGTITKRATAEKFSEQVRRLVVDLELAGARRPCLDNASIMTALMLSEGHPGKVLVIFADDGECDSALVCASGQIVGGRVRASQHVFEVIDGAPPVVVPRADLLQSRHAGRYYQLARDESERYFGWPIALEPEECEEVAYQLIASKDCAERPFAQREEIEARLATIARAPTPLEERLRAAVDVLDQRVLWALQEDLIEASRPMPDIVEIEMFVCRRAMSWCEPHEHGPRLVVFLSDVANYAGKLRPKQAFRHDLDFLELNSSLRRRWDALKAAIGRSPA